MKYIDFSDKPISTKQLMLWRLWDALGDLNRARGEMKAAEETAQTAGISAMIYTIIHSKIADLGETVSELIEDWERKPA